MNFEENTYGIVKRLEVIQEWLSRFRESNRPFTVLDYGCGTGDLITEPLSRAGYDVLGVDVHAESIDMANARYQAKNLRFRAASLQDLLSEHSSFNAIVCSEVLEHVPRPGEFLTSLKTLLRSDGLLIITTPNGFGSYEMLSRVQRIMHATGLHRIVRTFISPTQTRADLDRGYLNNESVHVQFFSLRRLESIFKQNGLRVIERRARTFLCGPFADPILTSMPFRKSIMRWNASVADALPLRCAADWMFLLQHETHER